ncbi:MAG: caspase family protein [Flammeovirgaceae bacterium]|nr:caspase family protein [Flammeovirgaceae bacterium]
MEVRVENSKNGIISSTRSILVGKDAIANAIDVNRSDYALIFATNNYDDLNNLTNPIYDSKTIEELLRTRYGFKTEIITDATHDEILEKISEYNTRKFNPQDQLLVFFAGHGVFDDNLNEGFVAARDSKSNDKGRSTYIPHSILTCRD